MQCLPALIYRQSVMSGHPCQEGDHHAQGHSAGKEDPWREGLVTDYTCIRLSLNYKTLIFPRLSKLPRPDQAFEILGERKVKLW